MAVGILYDKAWKASRIELIKFMEEAYLQGIDQLSALPHQGDFDVAAFRKDVEAIFSIDKW